MKLPLATILFTIAGSVRSDHAGGHPLPARTLVVTMKDGTIYKGTLEPIKYSEIPIWMQPKEVHPRYFTYFIRTPRNHWESELWELESKPGHNISSDCPSRVEMNPGGMRRYRADDFILYDVNNHDHRSASRNDDGDFPRSYCIFLSIPTRSAADESLIYVSKRWHFE